jgi:transcription termination factor Rho
MYDILQLNDMLLTELLDVAEQLKVPNAKKLEKQDLIYKILDKQAVSTSPSSNKEEDDKPKRKRIVKAITSNTTEEAEVMEPIAEDKNEKKVDHAAPKRTTVKKTKKIIIKKEASASEKTAEDEKEEVKSDDAETIKEEKILPMRPQKKEPVFNVEFDGIIESEGVLEMMPDGYGFLRSSRL